MELLTFWSGFVHDVASVNFPRLMLAVLPIFCSCLTFGISIVVSSFLVNKIFAVKTGRVKGLHRKEMDGEGNIK